MPTGPALDPQLVARDALAAYAAKTLCAQQTPREMVYINPGHQPVVRCAIGAGMTFDQAVFANELAGRGPYEINLLIEDGDFAITDPNQTEDLRLIQRLHDAWGSGRDRDVARFEPLFVEVTTAVANNSLTQELRDKANNALLVF